MTELESTSRRKRRARVIVFGHDGFGMLRTMLGDMIDRLIQIIDHAHRQNRREIFRVPVFVAVAASHPSSNRTGTLAAAQFDAFCPDTSGASSGSTCAAIPSAHQQGLHGVAGAVTLGLGVDGDRTALSRSASSSI